jgi:hypothetical protein
MACIISYIEIEGARAPGPINPARVRRRLNRRSKRYRTKLRYELVHAAGCTFRGFHECATRQELPTLVREARELGVSIPRSLRHLATRKGGR